MQNISKRKTRHKIYSLLNTPTELVNKKRGGDSLGEESAKSTSARVPPIAFSKDAVVKLKSTLQAEKHQRLELSSSSSEHLGGRTIVNDMSNTSAYLQK